MTINSPTLNSQLVENQFLVLHDPENSRIHFLNNTILSYCGLESDILDSDDFYFFPEYVHPEDYLQYSSLLENLNAEEEKSAYLRIKSKNGDWSTFRFINRIYNGTSRPLILSIGEPAIEASKIQNMSHDEPLNNEYENLLNSLDEGFCIIEMIYNKQGKPIDYLYLKTNNAFEKHVSFKNIIGKTMLEVMEIPQVHLLDVFAKVTETGESKRFHETNKNIENGWLDLYAFKIGDLESRKVGLLFRNITNKKLAEESLKLELIENHKDLQESKELLQSVFDTTNLGIAVLKAIYAKDGTVKDFLFKRVNKVLQEMYYREDVLDRTYMETTIFGPELGIFEAYKDVLETGNPFDQEFYLSNKMFNNWFRVTARKQNDLIITTLEDITERKIKAKELEETMRFKQELVRATPEVIMIINLNTFSVRYINKDIVPEVGLTRNAVQGKSLKDILPYIHPRDREKVIILHKNLLKSSEELISEIDVRLKLKGESWEWFNLRGKVFKRRDEAWVDEYVLLIRNITEQKETQKALIKAEKLSIQGDIARTFAHELRNPLASIVMVSEVLKQKMKLAGHTDLDNYFNILKRSSKSLNELVTTLLNASNYSPAVLKPEDLGEIMDHIIHKASDRIYLSGIKVIKKFNGKFPILADKEKLEIALLNIIVNASEATSPGEGIIEIEIREQETDYMLRITDNGEGMDHEQIDHLFEAFYTKKDSGMGVGMSSVKNILDEHDAHIKVLSKPKEGTTFRIYFHNENLV